MTLPNFLVVGAQKSATSWLDYCLRQHPDVFMPIHKKELHFFDSNFDKGVKWYEDIFKTSDGYDAIGEVTPGYLYCRLCPGRIYRTLPDVKLIVSLRNPIDRAFSQYKMILRKKGVSPKELSFRESWEKYPPIIQRGLYYKQLKRFGEYFPIDKIHIIIYDDLAFSPDTQLKRLFTYLSIKTSTVSSIDFKGDPMDVNTSSLYKFWVVYRAFREVNHTLENMEMFKLRQLVGKVERVVEKYNRYDLSLELKKSEKLDLVKIFRDDIEKLSKLINIDLRYWIARDS